MKIRSLLNWSLVALLFSCSTQTNEDTATKVELDPILDQYAAELYELNPLLATSNGVHDYNDRLAINISSEYIERQLSLNKKYLDTLATINTEPLTDTEKLSIELLSYKLSMENEQLSNGHGLNRPVDQFVFSFPQNFATVAVGASYVPFKTEQDYRNFMSRMEYFSQWVDQSINNMTTGLELNDKVPKASMVKVPAQLKPLFETAPEESIFYRPLETLPEDLDSATVIKLKQDYTAAIATVLQPAYKKLNDFIENQYIPNARETTGLLDNSNGKEEYQYWLNFYTTLDMTPDQIFDLGIREVARIRNEMDSLKESTGFEGDLKAFFNYVKTDPKFFPFDTEEEVLDRYRSFESKMEPELKKMFNLVPEAGFEVRATEKFREAGANAQYNPPSRDGKRPGIFYETVRDPKAYNYIDMETLFIHEAIPGHHYQIALQQEADIPEFRKSYWMSAYGEGWALYAETLGLQLGMFTDPYQYLGRLSNDMERAVRCVVDAGMHHKGWTREQAIQYILDNQPVTAFVAEQRIERYMVTPGQAVSYKVGEQTIIRLREEARAKLGDKFDIREYHDEVLRYGALPLKILEKQINRWVESQLSEA
ncbi:DUF885 domain-containing protein [Fulvivirga lutimaris]|uniref:DUF885 domain-containing protein n=1 Tax=Fulvivirga lutimaris TaxID=1819566 RepID=UPI0012BBB22E|nr:DUF885 domain-containing protein [Fulvivirga lutimaris]MTI41922.1 DUF885 domain-containing protein [Fulvivirga lutimaris]